jgi:RND family efflux transporter MFP subunit
MNPPRALRGFWPRALVIFFGALVFLGCGRHGKQAPDAGSKAAPSKVNLKRPVEIVQAKQKSLIYFVDTTGQLEAEGQIPISPGVSGIVDEVLFREGQWVDRDSILVKVDKKRYETGVELAAANEKRAQANVELAKDSLSRTERTEGGAISEEDRFKSRVNVLVAEAEKKSAENARILAEQNLYRSRVRAPVVGQMNTRTITVGSYVEEKTVIGTMADLSHIRLVGYIPEKAAPLARDMMLAQARVRTARMIANFLNGPPSWPGMLATHTEGLAELAPGFDLEMTLQPFPNKTFRGRVFYMSTVADPLTHMFECKAEVYHDDPSIELKPGYSAEVRLPLQGRANACIIPEEAMRASEQGFIVFVPEKNEAGEWVARMRSVIRGYQEPSQTQAWVEVLKGVQPGDWIIRRGADALEDGTPIAFPKEQELQMIENPPGQKPESKPPPKISSD